MGTHALSLGIKGVSLTTLRKLVTEYILDLLSTSIYGTVLKFVSLTKNLQPSSKLRQGGGTREELGGK